MEKSNKVLNSVLIALVALLVIFSLTLVVVECNKPVATPQNVTVQSVQYDDSALKASIASLNVSVNKVDDFKSVALSLASADISSRQYRDLFNFLVTNGYAIDEKADISAVILKDSSVEVTNLDKKDASVTENLKVYFEDSNGDKKKVLVDADTIVKDNEADSTTYSLA